MDVLSLISLIIGTAIGIAGIIIGVAYAYRIAKKSGAFRKALLNISLMAQSLIRDPQFSEVIFGYPLDRVDEHDKILFVLPFEITNDGELSAKNVVVRLVFPLSLRCGGFDPDLIKFMKVHGAYEKSEIKRRSFTHAGFEHVDYVIPEIEPKGRVILEEAIDIAHASGMPFTVDAVSRDGVPLRVKGFLEWSVRVYIRVSATDMMPIDGHFQVRSYQAYDKEELGDRIMEHETKALREALSKMGASKEFVSEAHAPGVRKRGIVVIPKLRRTPKPEKSTIKGTIYIGEPENSEIRLVEPSKDYSSLFKLIDSSQNGCGNGAAPS